jgi:hypothetical protein
MNSYPIEIYKVGGQWVAHRDDDHDCTAADADSYHGVADSEVGALRRLIKAEADADYEEKVREYSTFQPIGNNTYRVGGASKSAVTGRYITGVRDLGEDG